MSETAQTNPLADLPNVVDNILKGSQENGENKSLDQKLKENGIDEKTIEKLRDLGINLIGDDVSKLPKNIQDKLNDQIKKAENTTKDQLYQTIDHLKEKINKLNAGMEEKAKIEEELRRKQLEEEEAKRLEKLTAEEKVLEMQKNMQEALKSIKENAEREARELRQQLHIRDMEKVRDRLLSEAGDIIVELLPNITPETTEETLMTAIQNAKTITENYKSKLLVTQEVPQAQQAPMQNQQFNQNNILPNNKGGRNALETRELEGLMRGIEQVTDVKELERRLSRIQQLNGSIL